MFVSNGFGFERNANMIMFAFQKIIIIIIVGFRKGQQGKAIENSNIWYYRVFTRWVKANAT